MTREVPAPGPWIAALECALRGADPAPTRAPGAALESGPQSSPIVEVIQQKAARTVWRLVRESVVVFVKCGREAKRAEVRREAESLLALAGVGVSVPALLAAGDHDGREWIVMESVPGRPLLEALVSCRARRALLDRIGAAARRLHEAGWAHPDLTADHVFVAADRVTLIDVARAHPGASDADRARDLAALLCSLPRHVVGRVERVRLLRAASGLTGQALRDLVGRIEVRTRKLARRTRWRHAYLDAVDDVCAFAGADDASPDDASSGDPFTALLEGRGATVLRTLADRTNRRFVGPSGQVYFQKAYPAVARGLSPAQRERDAIDLFARVGIPTCREAAYGEDVKRGSFLVVVECAGQPLDDLLRAGVTAEERRALARETGRLFGRMRRAGLRHRDAYPCHVFVAKRTSPAPDGSQFELRLIDMTRAGRAPFPRGRWYVKDAAQLWHGVPRGLVRPTDALRWLRTYADLPKLDSRTKRFARRVAAKERRIAARQERKRGGSTDG